MEKFIQTVSSVNYNKGIFSLYFVGQDQNRIANGIMAESDNDLELKQVVHMPASGFMYMVSMIKNMLEDPRMEAEFDKLVAAGFLPTEQTVENITEQLKMLQKQKTSVVEEKIIPKKRTIRDKK